MQLISSAFEEGATIPVEHTCDGDDVSPSLSWSDVPDGADRFALICDDPDAPGRTFVHWVIYDIPGETTELPRAVPTDPTSDEGWKQGSNDFGRTGYGGPCPPPGAPHRYFFKLYAIDGQLELDPGASKQELLQAMDGQVVAEAQLMGKYAREG